MSEQYANSSEIIPQIKKLKLYVTNSFTKGKLSGLGTTLDALSKSLDTRLEIYLQNPNCILGTFFDPRYKYEAFKNESNGSARSPESIELLVIEKYIKYEDEMRNRQPGGIAGDGPEGENDSAINVRSQSEEADFGGFTDTRFDFDSWAHAQLFSRDHTSQSGSSTAATSSQQPNTLTRLAIQNELAKYKICDNLDREGDPFTWWKEHKALFPLLSVLAEKYLSCPPSSVESERLFSEAGLVYSPHRSRLRADTGEKLIFLNFNLRLLPKLEYKY
ncbi:unnamed protein product, partial [Meganyctiphanes norvegica]